LFSRGIGILPMICAPLPFQTIGWKPTLLCCRDSGYPLRLGLDLSAAFSCGSFSSLDSGRVESAPARTAGIASPVALRHLRVRI
jgi:hypothetical protein